MSKSSMSEGFGPEYQALIEERFARVETMFTVTIAYSDGDVLNDHLDKDRTMELVKAGLTIGVVKAELNEQQPDLAVPSVVWITVTPDAPDHLPERERA